MYTHTQTGGSGSSAAAVEAALQALERGPVALARRVAGLAVMSALYRDMALVATSIDARLAGSPNPLYDTPRPADEAAADAAAPPPAYPLHDTTKLSDLEAPRGLQLEQRHMDKISAWAALQPSHIETSHTLLTGVNLFPPQVRGRGIGGLWTHRGHANMHTTTTRSLHEREPHARQLSVLQHTSGITLPRHSFRRS
jgi:hypothetical protein